MPSNETQPLSDKYLGKTIPISENSLFLWSWHKQLRKWNRSSLHSMPNMPKSSMNLEMENSLLDDCLTTEST